MAKTPMQAALHNSHDAHEHHIVPTFTYVKVLIFLTVMMLLTIFAASKQISGVGPFSGVLVNQTIALVIAIAKAFAVVWIFMGVKWGTKLTKLWAVTGFVWFFLLGLVLIDYPMRAFETVHGWEGPEGTANHGRDGSALPRVVPPTTSREVEELPDPNLVNIRPRQ